MKSTLCLALALLALPTLHAQIAATKLPNYDVVSIRPNNTGSGSIMMSIDDDHFEFTNVTLKGMLMEAYNVRPAQLSGFPSWVSAEHFDVHGKVLDGDKKMLRDMKDDQRRLMFQAMLKERFGLVVHWEQRNMPVYDLMLGKDGPKMKALPEQTEAEKDAAANDPVARESRGSLNVNNRGGDGITATAGGVKMGQFVATLSNFAGRTVLDKTGLTGEYTFSLNWLPEENANAPRADAGNTAEPPPSLFTAVQEQLGLRLVANKGDVPVLVVDHVDHPTDN